MRKPKRSQTLPYLARAARAMSAVIRRNKLLQRCLFKPMRSTSGQDSARFQRLSLTQGLGITQDQAKDERLGLAAAAGGEAGYSRRLTAK